VEAYRVLWYWWSHCIDNQFTAGSEAVRLKHRPCSTKLLVLGWVNHMAVERLEALTYMKTAFTLGYVCDSWKIWKLQNWASNPRIGPTDQMVKGRFHISRVRVRVWFIWPQQCWGRLHSVIISSHSTDHSSIISRRTIDSTQQRYSRRFYQ
jgi:hypothetical protein